MKRRDFLYLRILNIFAFVSMVTMNILSELLPINGVTSAEVSDRYASLFTPAGITFSIWAVIYVALAYFTVWQAVKASDEVVDQIGLSFTLSCALNIGWLILWHYNMIFLATIAILLLMLVLYSIKDSVSDSNWLVRASFGTYLAWITVASIASLFIVAGVVFKDFAYGTLAQILVWAAIAVILYLTYMRLRNSKDYAYALTMIWAIGGIGYERATSVVGIGFNHILLGAIISVVLIVIMIELTISGTIKKDPVAYGAS